MLQNGGSDASRFLSAGPRAPLGRPLLVEDSRRGVSGSQPSGTERLVTGLCGCRGWVGRLVVVAMVAAARAPCPPPSVTCRS